MSDDPVPPAAPARLVRPRKALRLVAAGLLVGLVTLGVAVAAALALAKLAEREPASCAEDAPCLPDLGPVILAILSVPVLMAVVGPLAARILRLPAPGLFAMPVIWAVVVACVLLGPADRRQHWPFDSPVGLGFTFLLPYAGLALWAGHRRGGTSPDTSAGRSG
ncbi:hypothetical protein ABZ783_33010 [Micromonospora sp. NPDC047738]|uniref:hypothetical protein n=1 Tax=Micromonospora sp. NPDC047738 TaxID=3155741 RepID=UPI0033EB0F91